MIQLLVKSFLVPYKVGLSGASPTKKEKNSIVEDFSFYLCGLQNGMDYTMRLKTKQRCVDCHFFMRKNGQSLEYLGEIEAEERDQARQGDYSWKEFEDDNILTCSFGVWDKQDNNKFDQKEYHQLIAETDRQGFCFWWKYHPGMLLPAAKILQEREAKNHDAEHDRSLTRRGLRIATIALFINAAGLFVNAGLKVYELFFSRT